MRPAIVLPSLLALGLTACDIPTQLPRYDTRWELVAVRDTIATADLLPAHLRVGEGGFVIDSFSARTEVRLREVCELCTCFSGTVPAMTIAPHDWPVRLPAGVVSARLERGRARVVVENQVGFDILDDGEGNRGFLAIELMDTRHGEALRSLVLSEPFPPGDSLRLSFDLSGLELSPYLVARMSGFMPGSGCQEVSLTPESGFRATVRLEDVLAREVEVWVSDAALALPQRSFSLPQALADRLRSGEAEILVEVDVESRLPADVEIGVSAAGRQEELFTGRAALYTPLVIGGGEPRLPRRVNKHYVVQLEPLTGAPHLFLDTRNRFLGLRPLVLQGGESVAYQVRVRARVPSR